MTDNLVQLLPDHIANQIAAGEVIQRPASVVKELVENALDSGASKIDLIVKDSGKTLIQVIDNGCGMSETDARMALERHATSKLRSANDLFNLRTMGFRGEALASIVAVAQLEMKTRRGPDELGTRLLVEGSEVKAQEPVAAPAGTSMAVRNLFYNVPARRNFLKTDSVEFKHIREEFIRVALANPEIEFNLYHNDNPELPLPAGSLRQRIVRIFGKKYESGLVPFDEATDVLSITGYVGKPEMARKSRVGQFFFINNRFIKDSYLHHAVVTAYDNLLPKDTHPFYVIMLEIDPARIDVNVHPTKQEIKFEDQRMVYNFLKATIRQGMGRAAIMPTIDFETDNYFAPSRLEAPRATPAADDDGEVLSSKMNAGYSPGSGGRSSSGYSPGAPSAGTDADEARRRANNKREWQQLYEGLGGPALPNTDEGDTGFIDYGDPEPSNPELGELLPSRLSSRPPATEGEAQESSADRAPVQLHQTYIISSIKSGWLLIDQRAAHWRVLFEEYLANLRETPAASQQSLFPQTLELSHGETELLQELLPGLRQLGFEVESFGGNTFIIKGVPAEVAGKQNEKEILEGLLQQYRDDLDLESDAQARLARSLANRAAIRRGTAMDVSEMRSLINRLFACEQPGVAPNGDRVFVKYELPDVEKLFRG